MSTQRACWRACAGVTPAPTRKLRSRACHSDLHENTTGAKLRSGSRAWASQHTRIINQWGGDTPAPQNLTRVA